LAADEADGTILKVVEKRKKARKRTRSRHTKSWAAMRAG